MKILTSLLALTVLLPSLGGVAAAKDSKTDGLVLKEETLVIKDMSPMARQEARDIAATRRRIDRDRKIQQSALARIRGDQAALLHMNQRLSEIRAEWDRARADRHMRKSHELARRHQHALAERDRLRADLARARQLSARAKANEVVAERKLQRERAEANATLKTDFVTLDSK